jgi:hypothetical protein
VYQFAHERSIILDDTPSLQYIVDHQDEFVLNERDFGKISNRRHERRSFLNKYYEVSYNCFSNAGVTSFDGDSGLGNAYYLERKLKAS